MKESTADIDRKKTFRSFPHERRCLSILFVKRGAQNMCEPPLPLSETWNGNKHKRTLIKLRRQRRTWIWKQDTSGDQTRGDEKRTNCFNYFHESVQKRRSWCCNIHVIPFICRGSFQNVYLNISADSCGLSSFIISTLQHLALLFVLRNVSMLQSSLPLLSNNTIFAKLRTTWTRPFTQTTYFQVTVRCTRNAKIY